MAKMNLDDLQVFRAVAEAKSFTRAAAQLGVSASALSQNIRALEKRLGVQLLTRTTRNVSPTAAGMHALEQITPALDQINVTLNALSDLREKPSGKIRLTAGEHPMETILWNALNSFVRDYPEITVDVDIDNTFKDLASAQFDAGIRIGEQVSKEMVAIPIGPQLRMIVVGSPDYFQNKNTPLTPHDLTEHTCINLRLPTHDSLYAWEFEKDGKELRVSVEGSLVFTRGEFIHKAAIAGHGLAYLFEDQTADDVAAGRLIRVLEDWSPPFPGYHLYYPGRRLSSRAFSLLVEKLRFRSEKRAAR